MRRFTQLACLFSLVSLTFVQPISAQAMKGSKAAGFDAGVFFPDEAFEKTLTIDAFGEYYLTPNISVRGLFGWASPGVENRTEDHFRQVHLLFNGLYSWSGNQWHPYVTAGAGAYFLRQIFENAEDPDSEVRGGINFGGGVEYFLDQNSTSMFKVELRFDVVTHPEGFPDATGVTLTFGYKRFF
jgi:outer membrane protein with beta-barrel domain